MKMIDAEDISIGMSLPMLVLPPISRQILAVYCGASGDHNPIHVDIDFAKESGLDDVIAHGMLVMSYLGRMLTSWAPPQMTRIGDIITVKGKVVNKSLVNNQWVIDLDLEACDQSGEVKLSGNASIVII
jgi:acyl dehydratase